MDAADFNAIQHIRSIDLVEINEAFAAIAIVVARELGRPEDIVNVEGGAIAYGHPIGATGAVLTTKLIHSMRRDDLTRGLVTLCSAARLRATSQSLRFLLSLQFFSLALDCSVSADARHVRPLTSIISPR